ncbi:methylmalonyl-CoA mutase family protein [Aestuariivirga sp.]|uniref:methylmalonyl-CoA mutase family protein n=1 Tax=Aestuariivirga sp. TaxID=2650926 RepID=UPI00301B3745
MSDLKLASDFPALGRADWMKRVEAVLKGASFEEKLVHASADGIRLEPLYGQLAGHRAARATQVPWTLFQRVDHPDAARANELALDDLANGATGLVLVTRDSAAARGYGIDTARLARVLQGVHLHAIALRVEGNASMALAELIATQPIDPERLNVSFALTNPADAAELARLGYTGPYMEADGRSWHEQGATEAQELGATLATAVATLRSLERLNDVHLVRSIGITLAANQDMFATLAKFRAIRLLWRRVLQAAGLPDAPLRLHAETSWRMMAVKDPHTNILRATAAVFGAALGGADSITVLPLSLAQGLPNAFARRVARNVQNVLAEESNLWRVADPALGAGYIETYTQGLAQSAWKVFQAAEAGDWPLPDPDSQASFPIIGTSAYPLMQEAAPETEALS